MTLNDDGSVSGSMSGSWTLGGNNIAVVTVEGEAFRRVFSRQWNESEAAFQITFSGISAEGETLWGIRTGG